uniref:Ig-like domain-containing protein n=1 Tax=Lepisosteus oculatus TaxID=7918 RepID=W5MXI6_LEPOC
VLYLCCCFKTFSSIFTVFAEVKTVTGNRGGDAVLPCNTEAHEDSRATVFWRYKTNIIVHSVNDGVENLSQQDSRFKNRTRMFPNEFRQGKFSLELSRLQDNDTGSYTCYIPSKSFQEHIELNVT